MEIAAHLAEVRRRIEAACLRSGRDPARVTLIGATKGVDPARLDEAVRAGLGHVAENWVQEATAKKPACVTNPAWHLIGHLQRNKVREALRLFDMIGAVDSLRLAEEISRRASTPVPVLIEVNVGGEASKFGLAPGEVGAAVAAIGALPNIDLQGLMTVAPAAGDPEDVRPVFRTLRALADANGLREVSMGMTNDYEVAIEEGATMVRVGRAIFGERSR
jgi:pyridoxal phosphate enzyme (YggS family)